MAQQHFAVNLQYCYIVVEDCCNLYAISVLYGFA